MPEATHSHRADNPLCGDEVTVFLQLDGDIVADASWEGVGCAVSIAAASLLTNHWIGKPLGDVLAMNQEAVMDLVDAPLNDARRRCASLAWEAGLAALGSPAPVANDP